MKKEKCGSFRGKVVIAFLLAIAIYLAPLTANAQTVVNTGSIYTYEEMVEDMTILCQMYPDTLSCRAIGSSVTGLPIYVIIMGNPSAPHSVVVSASIHAREYQNTLLLMNIIEDTAPSFNQDVCYYIVPMINPDGVTIVQGGIDRRWKANGRGVDLNRNFPVGWGFIKEPDKYNTVPGREYYCGSESASEPETKAMMSLLTERKYDCTITFHQQGHIMYYGCDGAQEGVNAKSANLAMLLKQMNGYSPIYNGLPNGGMGDYINVSLNTPNVTIETGTSAPSPVSAYPKVYKQNKNILNVVNACVHAW